MHLLFAPFTRQIYWNLFPVQALLNGSLGFFWMGIELIPIYGLQLVTLHPLSQSTYRNEQLLHHSADPIEKAASTETSHA